MEWDLVNWWFGVDLKTQGCSCSRSGKKIILWGSSNQWDDSWHDDYQATS